MIRLMLILVGSNNIHNDNTNSSNENTIGSSAEPGGAEHCSKR